MSFLRNERTGVILARNVRRATSAWARAVGLLCYGEITPQDGLWLDRCAAIHTVGMRQAIDVVFLDAQQRVIMLRPSVRPFTALVMMRGSKAVVELGVAERDIHRGDHLRLLA